MRRVLPWVAVLALSAYYLFFAQVSLRAGFSHDDLMNMHAAVTAPWHSLVRDCVFFFLPSDQYRPVGAVFYRVCYAVFGAQPLPLHVGLIMAWMGGLAAFYYAAQQLSQSAETAWLATLLTAHHSARPFFYYNAGFCYDILCFLFYFVTLAYYLRARRRGLLSERRLLLLTTAFVLALGSKEMAVSLPLVLAGYEWWRGHGRDWRFVMLSSVMTALFIGGRVLGAGGIAGEGGYGLAADPALYLSSWNNWLSAFTFHAPEHFPTACVALALTAILAGSWLAADAGLRATAVLMFAGALPLAFLRQPRGLEAACIPMAGLALTLAWWLTRFTWIVPWRGRGPLVCALAWIFLWDAHGRRQPPEDVLQQEGRDIAQAWNALRQATPGIRANAKVLITRDAFTEPMTWATAFMARIDHGRNLQVTSAAKEPQPPNTADFDWVLEWCGNRFYARKTPVVPK